MIAGASSPVPSSPFRAFLFDAGVLNAVTQTACWCVIFFFASAGASSAYLTVSEIFPVEVRAKAIAVFFAIAQSFGALGPWLYGELIGNGQDHFRLFVGYLIGAGVMIIGGVVTIFLGRRCRAAVARGHCCTAALGHPPVGPPLGGDRRSPVPGGTQHRLTSFGVGGRSSSDVAARPFGSF